MATKDIYNYEGLYSINTLGEIWRLPHWTYYKYKGKKRRRFFDKMKIAPRVDKDGYLTCALRKCRKTKYHKVHRLIMNTFIGPSNLVVNHKDGDKLNNDISNLEYMTIKENNRHKLNVLGHRMPSGNNHWGRKIPLNDYRKIVNMRKDMSAKNIADIYKVHPNTIHKILREFS